MIVAPPPRDKLIVALDLSTLRDAQEMVESLEEEASYFKVGLQLFTSAGPPIIQFLKRKGLRVFLDLKFHDIPNTVTRAGIEAVKHGVDMFTLHIEGGMEMMKKCRDQCIDWARKEGAAVPKILGVTVLTSTDALSPDQRPEEYSSITEKILHLSEKALVAGLDGIVTSPVDLPYLRKKFPPPFLMVVPGIRPAGSDPDDQKRTATPSQAVQRGADHIVIGRPILQSPNPRETFRKILKEMDKV